MARIVLIEKHSKKRSKNNLWLDSRLLVDAFVSKHDSNEVSVVDDQHGSSDPKSSLHFLANDLHNVLEFFPSCFPDDFALSAVSA